MQNVHQYNITCVKDTIYAIIFKTISILLIVLSDPSPSCMSLPLFGNIDHTIILERLHTFFEISEWELSWFKSFLSETTHPVNVGSILSHLTELQFDMWHGFVLGPIVSLMTKPMSSIVQSNNSNKYYFYTHDTQLYIAYLTSEVISLYANTQKLPQ